MNLTFDNFQKWTAAQSVVQRLRLQCHPAVLRDAPLKNLEALPDLLSGLVSAEIGGLRLMSETECYQHARNVLAEVQRRKMQTAAPKNGHAAKKPRALAESDYRHVKTPEDQALYLVNHAAAVQLREAVTAAQLSAMSGDELDGFAQRIESMIKSRQASERALGQMSVEELQALLQMIHDERATRQEKPAPEATTESMGSDVLNLKTMPLMNLVYLINGLETHQRQGMITPGETVTLTEAQAELNRRGGK
jgi:hypothetical protein